MAHLVEGSGEHPPRLLLTTDETTEGELVEAALSARGYRVEHVPLGDVAARAGERPGAVVLLDVDIAGAAAVAVELRADGRRLVCVGEAASLVSLPTRDASFQRPVDIDALLAEILSLEVGGGRRVPTPLPSASGFDSDPSPALAPDSLGLGDLGDLEGGPPSARALRHGYSAELSALLESAEQRVQRSVAPPSVPPVDDLDAAQVHGDDLSGLDEPLEIGPADGTGPDIETDLPLSTPDLLQSASGTGVQSGPGSEAKAPSDPPRLASSATSLPEAPAPVHPSSTLPPSAPGLAGAAVERPSPGSEREARTAAVARPAPPLQEHPTWPHDATPVQVLAEAIARRLSGCLLLVSETGGRRVVLHEGDVVTSASSIADESLVAFLVERGDFSRELQGPLARIPPFGRLAGAALVAQGYLGQEDLWPVLRAHAEWVLARALAEPRARAEIEAEAPARLRAEPSVFGGSTGAEIFVETVRRAIPPDVSLERLGGRDARLTEGERIQLLTECALGADGEDLVRAVVGYRVAEVVGASDGELPPVLYALAALGVLSTLAPARPRAPGDAGAPLDLLDDEAIRARIRARRALADEADYFCVLGVPPSATGYDVRRAYLELRRSLEPSRLLTPGTGDLYDDLLVILDALDEAYDVLRDPVRRERYRRAIASDPPADPPARQSP